MKPNVDLTLNRDFMKRNPIRELKEFFKRGGPYPWSPKKNMLESPRDSWMLEPVLTGDKTLRKEKVRYVEFSSGETCECCGYKLSDILPWERTGYLLCPACDGRMDERHKPLWGDYMPHTKELDNIKTINLSEIQFTIEQLIEPGSMNQLFSDDDLL